MKQEKRVLRVAISFGWMFSQSDWVAGRTRDTCVGDGPGCGAARYVPCRAPPSPLCLDSVCVVCCEDQYKYAVSATSPEKGLRLIGDGGVVSPGKLFKICRYEVRVREDIQASRCRVAALDRDGKDGQGCFG